MPRCILDVSATTHDVLETALSLVWENIEGKKLTHWSESTPSGDEEEQTTPTLVLYADAEEHAAQLVVELRFHGTCGFIVDWLEAVDYPPMPADGGTYVKGWRISTELSKEGVVSVQPVWVPE